jgi:hypothetical protein
MVHLVPQKDSAYALDSNLFSQEDRNTIYTIGEKGIFTIKAYQQKSIEWQLKIICQAFVYHRRDINLIAFDTEVENLINLVGVLDTCGFAKPVSVFVTKVTSKAKPYEGKNTSKFFVKVER